jgi:chromosome partitioning protein
MMPLDLRVKLADTFRGWSAPALARGKRAAQVLAVASSKGGVGKTTTAVNLAMAFSRQGAHVLLLDLDPQAHVAAALQLQRGTGYQPLDGVLMGHLREVIEVAQPTPWPRLTVAGSDKSLGETEMVLSAKIGKELLLHGSLAVTRTHYDLIIIDCPPNLGTLTLNALCAADLLLVPTDMSILALEGVADIVRCVHTLRHRLARPVEICGIVGTRLDKRLVTANAAITASLTELWGDRLLRTQIPQSSSINAAHIAGQPVFDLAPKSAGAIAYRALAHELIPLLRLSPHAKRNLGWDQSMQRQDAPC